MKIGVIGAGQLGRMLALAGYPLGIGFRFLDRDVETPGGQVGDLLPGGFADEDKLAELARSIDVLTFDVENVPADILRRIDRIAPLRPPVAALATGQDRLFEKTLFGQLGIPTTRFHSVDSADDFAAAIDAVGLPLVLKARRLGYDGRGQAFVHEAAQMADAWARLGSVPAIVEEFVEFEREVSVIGARSTTGEQAMYPLAHNVHRDGILRHSLAPFADADLEAQARQVLEALLLHFDYAGVLTIEFFVRDGQLLANEIAPRVHNSGHWTIEGAVTSQFENHVRAILGLPLGATAARGHSAMVNFLGQMPPAERVLALHGAHFHDYGKSPRPGRKLGHCTLTADTVAERDAALERLQAVLEAGESQ